MISKENSLLGLKERLDNPADRQLVEACANEMKQMRNLLRRVNTDLIPHLRDTGHNAADREMSETIAAVRASI